MPELDVTKALEVMAEKRPLVHHITNWVTITDCAQVVRHWGCLPVMAHAREEVEEMVGLAGALVLNIGTLTYDLVEAMLLAAKRAHERGIPVVLDAVGVGATRLRTSEAQRLLQETRIDVLKGNTGEISTLAGAEAEVRGVEAISAASDMPAVVKGLAGRYGNVVIVTGEKDLVGDGSRTLEIARGHELMGRVVGTGCIGTSTVGCFLATGEDRLRLAATGMAAYSLAGERAAAKAEGPGDFLAKMFNEIAAMAASPGGIALEATEV
jgi:hydroxyethylthiazole kinase